MDADYFRSLFGYQYWARDKLLAAVRELSPTDYMAPRPMDYGSIHGTLVHIYGGEVIWHARWNGTSPPRMMSANDVPDLDTLTSIWSQHEAMVRSYLDGLSDDEVRTRVLTDRNTEGTDLTRLLWHTMAHLVNHGTNHRSEVAAAITQLGHSPGDLDMIIYFAR